MITENITRDIITLLSSDSINDAISYGKSELAQRRSGLYIGEIVKVRISKRSYSYYAVLLGGGPITQAKVWLITSRRYSWFRNYETVSWHQITKHKGDIVPCQREDNEKIARLSKETQSKLINMYTKNTKGGIIDERVELKNLQKGDFFSITFYSKTDHCNKTDYYEVVNDLDEHKKVLKIKPDGEKVIIRFHNRTKVKKMDIKPLIKICEHFLNRQLFSLVDGKSGLEAVHLWTLRRNDEK